MESYLRSVKPEFETDRRRLAEFQTAIPYASPPYNDVSELPGTTLYEKIYIGLGKGRNIAGILGQRDSLLSLR